MTMKVSVIIPVRNRAKALELSVRSVLEQSYREFELLVVDDGSDCPIRGLSEDVQVIRTSPQGVSAARNKGVREASNEWIAFLDSDDIWLPDKLKKQIAFHQEHPEILISQTNERWIRNGVRVNKKAHHVLASGDAFALSLRQCAISPSSVLVKRSMLERVGGFDERMLVCEDYDLWLRLAHDNLVGLVDEELIAKNGGHADQLSRSQQAIDRFRVYSILKLVASIELSTAHWEVARAEMLSKLRVLIDGSKKRTLPISHYQSLENFFVSACSQDRDTANDLLACNAEILLTNNPTI